MKFRAMFTAVALFSGAAHAQNQAQNTSDAARDEARKFYTDGVAQMKRKDYTAAHKSLAKANLLYEASTIKLQYALCLEKEAKVEEAKSVLRDLVAHPPQLSDSQPLKDAYGKGITELARLEMQFQRLAELSAPLRPQPPLAVPPLASSAAKPAVPLQPAYEPEAKPAAPPVPLSPAPATVVSLAAPVEPIRGATAMGTHAQAPAPNMIATDPKPEASTAAAFKVHSAGILLGADLGGATGDVRAGQEGVFGLHGGIYLLRHVYAGGRIGWYGSANQNARSSSQHFEFGVRTDDNGSGISVAGLLGARKLESWSVLSSASNSVSSSTQTELGLVAGKRFALGHAFYVSPEVALMHCLQDKGAYNASLGANNLNTPAATRIYLGVAGEFHIGL